MTCYVALQQLSDTEWFLRGIYRTRSTESTANMQSMKSIAQKTENFSANFSLPPRGGEAGSEFQSVFNENQANPNPPSEQAASKTQREASYSASLGKFESASALPVRQPALEILAGYGHRSDYILPIRIFIPARTSCAANRSHLSLYSVPDPAELPPTEIKRPLGIGTTQQLALKWLAREIL